MNQPSILAKSTTKEASQLLRLSVLAANVVEMMFGGAPPLLGAWSRWSLICARSSSSSSSASCSDLLLLVSAGSRGAAPVVLSSLSDLHPTQRPAQGRAPAFTFTGGAVDELLPSPSQEAQGRAPPSQAA
jgi:hypothetical protein